MRMERIGEGDTRLEVGVEVAAMALIEVEIEEEVIAGVGIRAREGDTLLEVAVGVTAMALIEAEIEIEIVAGAGVGVGKWFGEEVVKMWKESRIEVWEVGGLVVAVEIVKKDHMTGGIVGDAVEVEVAAAAVIEKSYLKEVEKKTIQTLSRG
jgi:hypothetical protein